MSPRLLQSTLAATLLLIHASIAADPVRPVPPPGIAVPEADRAELEKGVAELGTRMSNFWKELAFNPNPARADEMANVEIFHKAVDWALRYNEFFDPKQIDVARQLLAEGNVRLAALTNGTTPWNNERGLVVRAYRSTIDGSVQPYGLVLPDAWNPVTATARPLHFWCHGRGETLSELAFINDRMHNKGEFAPPGAIVCHLYGRFCCANKFAGERDLFEALNDIRKHYPIDSQRLVIRGFSMGGASTWQFATHMSGMWAAAAPGAGFAETAEFFHVFAPGKTPPPWWEQVLWRWYDCTTMAANLANTTTIAYSGEIDGQKQAADIMVKYAKEEGIEFPHIIGPQTGHKYHPDSKPQIEELVTKAVENGREPFPKKVHLTTYTLIYPVAEWLQVTHMEREWTRADLDATLLDAGELTVTTKNVSGFAARLDEAGAPQVKSVVVDGQRLPYGNYAKLELRKQDGQWKYEGKGLDTRPEKSTRLCGPVDHAFMSRFLFVEPTGKPWNEAIGVWTKSELEHAKVFWRKVYRGDAPVKRDVDVTDADMESCNLILWGDPGSNAVLGRIVAKTGMLPVEWTKETLTFKGTPYDAATHAPVLVHPNVLHGNNYIVINSGPTFREEALLNNSDQTPKLPDWAIIDIRTPADGKWPGLVIDAGFFDEEWKP